jgi:hypothetical protein
MEGMMERMQGQGKLVYGVSCFFVQSGELNVGKKSNVTHQSTLRRVTLPTKMMSMPLAMMETMGLLPRATYAPIAAANGNEPLANNVDNKYAKGNDDNKYTKGKDNNNCAGGNDDNKYAEDSGNKEYTKGNNND